MPKVASFQSMEVKDKIMNIITQAVIIDITRASLNKTRELQKVNELNKLNMIYNNINKRGQ